MDLQSISPWFETGIGIVAFFYGMYHAIMWLWKRHKKNKAKRSEEQFSVLNMRIWEILSEVRMRVKASRVTLTQFHNGGKFSDGASMRKMSITHQSCDTKISSTMSFRQDVLVSRFVEIVEILKENLAHIRDVSLMKESNTKKFMELNDTLAFSILPVYCLDSMLVYGYITIEWCDSKDIDHVEEEIAINYLKEARDQVSFLLGSTKEYR
jgi:hypothetical protein